MSRHALVFAGIFGTAGALHLVYPKPFDDIVPPQLPISARQATLASGVAELGIAALLANPRTTHWGGRAATALLIAVWPANIYMAQQWADKPAPLALGAKARVPLQLPLIYAASRLARKPKIAPVK